LAKVACGQHHSLAIDDTGKIWSWGSGFAGQLGLDNTTSYNTPQLVDSDEWGDVACGQYHSLAIKDGKLYSFGDNSNGQLGVNDTSRRYVPTLVAETQRDGKSWVSISASYAGSFAIRSDGVLFGCGKNNYGQLGLGDSNDRDEFTQIDTGWSQIASTIYSSNGIKTI
jgi:alpha-tubulin suppressor-like RCC1 family protein